VSEEEFAPGGFEQRADIDQVFMAQLRNVNTATGEAYEEAVFRLLNLLPAKWREWVLNQEDRYLYRSKEFQYRRAAGVPMGTPENPVLADPSQGIPRTEDGEIDYTHPNVISPRLVEEEQVDAQELHWLVMQAAELAGLTWRLERETLWAGLKRVRPPPVEVVK